MSLKGKTVLITRPEKQAKILFDLVKKEDGTPVLLPLFRINALASEQLEKCLSDIQAYEKIIFISRNAVEICCEYLQRKQVRLTDEKCLALGAATLSTLNNYGYNLKQDVSEYANTESFLELELLSTTEVSGKSILIIRGQGGREILGDELQRRGAKVDYAEVYVREKVSYSSAQKHEIIEDDPDVIVLTSNEGINAYYELFRELETRMIETKPLVVLSERNKRCAEELGFSGTINIAKQTSDQGLLDACVKHFN